MTLVHFLSARRVYEEFPFAQKASPLAAHVGAALKAFLVADRGQRVDAKGESHSALLGRVRPGAKETFQAGHDEMAVAVSCPGLVPR